MSPQYETLNALQRGETVNLGGISLKMDPGEIKPRDLYIAERNRGPILLTADRIDKRYGCIFPTTQEYPYDTGECVKVCEA